MNYKLDGRKVVQCEGDFEWATAFENFNNHVVGLDDIQGVRVSTVFLGFDYNFMEGEAPLLFETMVFGEARMIFDSMKQRYSTWDEAEKGHAKVCEAVDKEVRRVRMRRPRRKK